jgi:hypothetical protein
MSWCKCDEFVTSITECDMKTAKQIWEEILSDPDSSCQKWAPRAIRDNLAWRMTPELRDQLYELFGFYIDLIDTK